MSKQQAPPVFAHFDFELWHVAAGIGIRGCSGGCCSSSKGSKQRDERTDRGLARHQADKQAAAQVDCCDQRMPSELGRVGWSRVGPTAGAAAGAVEVA